MEPIIIIVFVVAVVVVIIAINTDFIKRNAYMFKWKMKSFAEICKRERCKQSFN